MGHNKKKFNRVFLGRNGKEVINAVAKGTDIDEVDAPDPIQIVVTSKSKSSTDSNVHEGNEAYRAFMDKLTQSNVDEYVDLPTIAVMGDTSSGKSSLLSMIAQVELPSNDKLTTRCPIMLQMHKSDDISARVRVIWKDRPDGPNVDFSQRQVTEANWDDLTEYIAEAQAHIITKQNKEVARDIVSVGPTVRI